MKDLIIYLTEVQKLKSQDIPEKFYHATIKQRLSSIKKYNSLDKMMTDAVKYRKKFSNF